MNSFPIYSIGHGNRKIEDFLHLLQNYKIQFVVDVRSIPYSRFNPQFNTHELRFSLKKQAIRYLYLGAELGGRPQDPSCYTGKGKLDFEVMRKKDFFIEGINRLKTASEKEIKIAVMCSENKPEECHRSTLIEPALKEVGIPVIHIDESGLLKVLS